MTNTHLDGEVASMIADTILTDNAVFFIIANDVRRRKCYIGGQKEVLASGATHSFKGHPRMANLLNSIWESIVCELMRMDKRDAFGRRRSLVHILECETHKISREVKKALPRYMPDDIIKEAVRSARLQSTNKWKKN